mgnify:CR=1 FL=1
MSDKETRTVSLDAENHEYLKTEDNASAVVNDLVTQLRQGGDRQSAALDLQIEQKERELSDAQGTVDRLETELAELRQLKTAYEREEDARVEQAEAALEGAELEPTNPAVENWSGKLGMTPQELVEELT